MIFIFLLAILPNNVIAHGGGLNKSGCHHNRKFVSYHCHRGPLAGQSFSSKIEAQKRIGVRPLNTVPRTVSGKVRVIDGDTIQIRGKRIRLHGIDAPERKQKCLDADGNSYPCGKQATLFLLNTIQSAAVSCTINDVDRYKRLIGVCRLGGKDINETLVESGWAIAFERYSKDYVSIEAKARSRKIGIWQGTFVPPWKWRKGQRQ